MESETATDVPPMSKSKKKNLRRDMAAAGKAATAADPAKSEASTVAADNDIKQHVEDRLQQLVVEVGLHCHRSVRSFALDPGPLLYCRSVRSFALGF